jgi:hypothetical protein
MADAKKYTIIAFLVFSLTAILFLIIRTTGFFSKASRSNNLSNLENSYLFASPLQAKADGQEKIRINVFILDGRGLGISNQTISLKVSPYIKIENIQSITDSYGKAVFDLSSSSIGQHSITAQIDNQTLPQPVKISFY